MLFFRNDTDDYIKTAFLVILALALAGVIVFFILFYMRDSPNLERFRKGIHCIKTLNTTFCIKEIELYQMLSKRSSTVTHQSNGHEIASICYLCVYEYYFTVLTCDVETGPNDEEEMGENTNEDEHVDEENEGLQKIRSVLYFMD